MRTTTIVLATVTLLVVPQVVAAQSQVVADPETGFPPFGSFQPGAFDAVNLENLNVHFSVPITVSPGRGINLSHSVGYDSLVWKVVDTNGDLAWSPKENFGWQLEKVLGTVTWTPFQPIECGEICNPGCFPVTTWLYDNYAYVDPAGTKHEFNVRYHYLSENCPNPPLDILTGYATDNSGYYIDITNHRSPKVYTPDGSLLTGPQVATTAAEMVVDRLTDTNGNYIHSTVSGSTTEWIDTVGRTALKIETSAPAMYVKYHVLDKDGNYQLITVNFEWRTVQTNFECGAGTQDPDDDIAEYSSHQKLPTSIDLPNGLSYQFEYEDTGMPHFGKVSGRLSKVTLPTGGTYEYTYPWKGMHCDTATHWYMNRQIDDQNGGVATWSYIRSKDVPVSGQWTTEVTAPVAVGDTIGNESEVVFDNGQEVERKVLVGGGPDVLQKVVTTYATNGTPKSRTVYLDPGTSHEVSAKTETTFDNEGRLTEVKEFDWDSPVTPVRTTQNDYIALPPHPTLKRVAEVRVREGNENGTIRSRTKYAYDTTALTCVSGQNPIPQHNEITHPCTATNRGNLTSVTRYENAEAETGAIVRQFHYDHLGNVITAELDCCQERSWAFSEPNAWAYPDSLTSGPPGTQLTTSYTYDFETGQVLTVAGPNNDVTTYEYDTLKRPIKVTRPDLQFTDWTYDPQARTVATTSPTNGSNRAQLIRHYDTLGRSFKREVKAGSGGSYTLYQIAETKFDLVGRAFAVSNPYLVGPVYWNEARFDALSRPTVNFGPDGSSTANNTSYVYEGPAMTVTDPAGQIIRHEVDGLGRLVTVTEPNPDNNDALEWETRNSYNVLDQLTHVDHGDRDRSYTYNDLGRLLTETTPEAGQVTYTYETFGAVNTKTDARNVVADFDYDDLHRLEQVSYTVPGGSQIPVTPTVNYTYGTDPGQNENGRLKTMTDGVGFETYFYNSLGQVTQVDKRIDSADYTLVYTHEHNGATKTLQYPSGRVVTYSRDPLGRISEITSDDQATVHTVLTSTTFNDAGQMTGYVQPDPSVVPDPNKDVQATFGFHADTLQLNSIRYKLSGQPTEFFGLDYGYDHGTENNGLITSITDTIDAMRSVTYNYDALGRLTTATTSQWGLQWTYDRYGNRLSQAATAGAPPTSANTYATSNRFADAGYSYDAAGNLLGDPQRTWTCDAASMVTEIASSAETLARSYDGRGFAVKEQVTAPIQQPVSHVIRTGSIDLARYDNGALTYESVYLGGQKLATHEGASVRFAHTDHLSIRATSDGGTINASQGHYPFGEDWYTSGSPEEERFTSYQRDEDLGVDYARARMHVPSVGRFSRPDPIPGTIGFPQSLNRYSYALNNPVNSVDPLGLSPGVPFKDSPSPIVRDLETGDYLGGGGDRGWSFSEPDDDIIGWEIHWELESTTCIETEQGPPTVVAASTEGDCTEHWSVTMEPIFGTPLDPLQELHPDAGALGGRTPSPTTCVGQARVLQGNANHLGLVGGFPGHTIGPNSAAVDPAQWGGKAALRPHLNSIRGTIHGPSGSTFTFTNIAEVIGGPPMPQGTIRDFLKHRYPGLLLLELPGGPDMGVSGVEVEVPHGLPCPSGTVPQ